MNKKYKDLMYYKFCMYGFLKNQRYYDVFFILFLRSLNFSFLQIGLLISIKEISVQILEVPTGILADLFGRRRSMVLSFVSYIISFLIFYSSSSFIVFSIAMIMFAFGDTFRSGTHKAMIMQYLDIKNLSDKKLEYYGGTRGCSQLGSALSSIIAALMVFTLSNYRDIFLFTIIPYSIDLILMLSYPKYLEGEKKEEKKSIFLIYSHIKSTFSNITKTKSLLKLLLNSSISSANFSVTKQYLQPIIKAQALSLALFAYLNKYQRTSLLIGLLYFGIYIFSSWASKNSSKLNSIIGKGSVLKSSNFLYIINSIALLIAGVAFNLSLLWLSITMFFVFYFIQNGRRPMLVSYFGDVMSKDKRATILSIDSLLSSFIASFIAIVMGFIADKIGIGNAFIIYGIAASIIAPLINLR